MPAPLVTVIVPGRDIAAFAPAAIASLQAQTEPRWRAILIDDGSADATHDIFAAAAARELDLLARGRTVTCEKRDTDRYGRTVAICTAGGVDLGSALVAGGHAVAFRKYSKLYIPAEEAAKAAGRGLWAGEFQMPSDWRKEHKR